MRSLKISLTAQWILPIAIAVFLIPVFILQLQIMQYTRGAMIYPQDEAYIRMAIGKKLALNGAWSLSGNAFAPASSSILYPLLLASCFKLFGAYPTIPFIINLLTSLMILVTMQRWMKKKDLSPLGQTLILIAVIFLIPLPILTTIGMEHTLQILFSFLFLTSFCEAISGETTGDVKFRLPWRVYIYAFLITAIRYEGLFLLLIASTFLMFQKRWGTAALLFLVGFLPGLLFGIYSLNQGGYFLPNSILLKALPVPLNWSGIQKFVTEDMINKVLYPFPSKGAIAMQRILILLPLLYFLFLDVMRQHRLSRYLLIFCIAMVSIHMIFADVVLFYRYEGYLIACCIPVIGMLVSAYPARLIPRKGAFARSLAIWTCLILVYPLASRSWYAYTDTEKSCLHMYDQGYQAANFLRQYYNHSAVVLNQPGAAAWFSEGKMIDLVSGIWDMDVARSKQESYYRPEFQSFLVQKEKPVIAVIPQRDYNPYLFDKWERIASWTTYNNVTLGAPYVLFYAVDKQTAVILKKNLLAYRPFLPPGVKVEYFDEAPKY